MSQQSLKNCLRKTIREKKRLQSQSDMAMWSETILKHIESLPAFQKAGTVLLYYSLSDEVRTDKFIEKWKDKKNIILPVIDGDDLILKRYMDKNAISTDNSFHIKEPTGTVFTDYRSIDLAIIPGMSFDKEGNRLGRGKGYYDRLLKRIDSQKIGICFDFQVSESIPCEEFDFKMDEVWTEKGKLNI